VGGEIDSGGIGDCSELIAQFLILEPRCKESGGLGALTGRYNNNHLAILPIFARNRLDDPTKPFGDRCVN
jgi:hypothetical protein